MAAEANAVVDACAVILDCLPCLLRIAGACPENRSAELEPDDLAKWHRIVAMVKEIAGLVPRFDDPGQWGTKVVAMLRQRIRWNLELLYGWRRMPEILDPDEEWGAAARPEVRPGAPTGAEALGEPPSGNTPGVASDTL